MPDSDVSARSSATRERVVSAAMELLAAGGRDALSTRAICEAASVQAPTIYRIFGSKDGLMDALAEEGFAIHQRSYRGMELTDDPIEDLRTGWDQHVAFGLANPYLYSVMYGRADPATPSYAAVAANEGLRFAIHRVAEAGLLVVDEHHAATSVTAAGVGVTFTLLAEPESERSLEESTRMRELLIDSIVADRPASTRGGIVGAAAALAALLDEDDRLQSAERDLLRLWLDRMTDPE